MRSSQAYFTATNFHATAFPYQDCTSIMEAASNKNEFSDELSELISIRDELDEAKARRDAIIDACLKKKMDVEDLLSPVVDLHRQMLEKMNCMEEDMKVLETIENMGKSMVEQWYPKKIEVQQNIIRLRKDALSKRIDQLNDDKKKLSDSENDLEREEKEKLDLEALIEATEAELLKQREIRKELSSTSLSKEISEREAEYRHLENEYLKLKEECKSESVELQALRDNKNITSQKLFAQEAKYRNHLATREHMTIVFNDYKAKYERKLEKNQIVVLQLESIEEEREEEMDKLNLIINQYQDVYVKLQSDNDEVTNKMISEFGDVESFPQMILEAKANLAKWNIDCQTIDGTFNAECQKEAEIEKRELTLLAKEAELKQKFHNHGMEQLNVWATQNRHENGPIASPNAAPLNQNNVETEHEFVQPDAVPSTNLRKLKKTRGQRPQQTVTKAALNVADTTSSPSSLTPPNSIQGMSNADERRFRSWRALQMLRDNID